MTVNREVKGRAQNGAAKHFELSHGELAISDAVGQPADSDPIKPCYKKKTVVVQWQNHEKFSFDLFLKEEFIGIS